MQRAIGNLYRWAGVVVLNYHRIGDGRRSVFDRGLWSATEEGLDEQLGWLSRELDVIGPGDLPRVLSARRGRHAIVTFDDGHRDQFTAAYPILRSHRVPATFFVTTGFVDAPRLPWWDEIAWMIRTSARSRISMPEFLRGPVAYDEPDREQAVRSLLRAYKKLPAVLGDAFLDALADATGSGRYAGDAGERCWMTWEMLGELRAGGMTIGGHTVSHPILSRMSREEQWKEISGCAERLEQKLGIQMTTFSYPVGQADSFDDDTRACLRDAGVKTAFTYHGGLPRIADWDDYAIPRFAVEQDTTLEAFRGLVLAPWLTRA